VVLIFGFIFCFWVLLLWYIKKKKKKKKKKKFARENYQLARNLKNLFIVLHCIKFWFKLINQIMFEMELNKWSTTHFLSSFI